MPWLETKLMDARLLFVAACLRAEEPMSTLCLRAGISRRTGYKWLARYVSGGAVGLQNLSSARHTQSTSLDEMIRSRLLALRHARPTWGARKLVARLALDDPSTEWPAASTVGDLLRREGLATPRLRRSRDIGSKPALTEPSAPNVSWAMDFKRVVSHR